MFRTPRDPGEDLAPKDFFFESYVTHRDFVGRTISYYRKVCPRGSRTRDDQEDGVYLGTVSGSGEIQRPWVGLRRLYPVTYSENPDDKQGRK